MKALVRVYFLLATLMGLSACGVEMAGAAATGAAVKAQEIKQGAQRLDQMGSQIQAATDLENKKREELDKD